MIQISAQFALLGPIDNIRSYNGLVPNRQHAITRPNDDTVH